MTTTQAKQIRSLKWQNTRDLMVLADKVNKSLESSLKISENQNAACFPIKPTYITEQAVLKATELLKEPQNQDPMLIVEISSDKIEVVLVKLFGHQISQMAIVDRLDLKSAKNYQQSAEIFLAFIAHESYRLCKQHANCFGDLNGKKVLCGLIFCFQFAQTSIRESTVSKFDKNFFIFGCEGRDLVEMFNYQLMFQQAGSNFKIICTNMIGNPVAGTAGTCMAELASHNNEVASTMPDLLLYAGSGTNICSFAELNAERMIVDTNIYKFGVQMGSLEHELLKRFLTHIDFEINCVHMAMEDLYDLFIEGYKMCETVWIFLNKNVPDFEKRFPWLQQKTSISEEDISDFLVHAEKGTEFQSKLVAVYRQIEDLPTKEELKELCRDLRNRSAKMLAAVTYGIVKHSLSEGGEKRKIVIGLAGKVMLEMYGYKALFKRTLDQLQKSDSKLSGNGNEQSFEIECIEASKSTSYFGIVGLSKYIWNYCW